ncbi:MAG TPA: BhlA/UviB family holin-like peptide [Anaerolineales bacterium]
METLLCIGGIIAVLGIILFFYLLNTARKKIRATSAGKKEYTPV